MRRTISSSLLVLLAACSSPGEPNVQLQAPALEIIGGDKQVDTVTHELPEAVVARATDAVTSAPAAGVLLNWYRVVDTESTFVGAGLTNGAGEARLRPTLGTRAGEQGFVAWALDEDGRRAVHASATATALPGPLVYAGFLVPTLHVLGDSVLTLPIHATDAYGNQVASQPPVVALDDTVLVPAGPASWRAARVGIGRYQLAVGTGETIAVSVYAPAGPYRAERTVADTLFVETGTLVCDRIASTDGGAFYHVVDAVSIRSYAGAPPDTMRGSQMGERTVHYVTHELRLWPLRLGATGYELPQGGESPWLPTPFVAAAAGRWRFAIDSVAADSLVIMRP